MSADRISRRAFAGGIAALALARRAGAQGYAGLGATADGFTKVTPGKTFTFPADHGPHPEFRIEWWYLTANLVDSSGAACGQCGLPVMQPVACRRPRSINARMASDTPGARP